MQNKRLGFIGAGQMAEAIARGLLAAGSLPASALCASDPAEARRKLFESLGITATEDNLAVVRASDALLIAVKPQNLDELLKQVGPRLARRQVVISICAGCPTGLFEAASPEPLRVVRAMPNLPMRVRAGVTALCAGRHATRADVQFARGIFETAGRAVEVDERLMDAVTAVSGSGPAYFYFLVEVLIEAARREGLTAPVAQELAIQTACGAAAMMAAEDAPPEELRRRVTSKGGTTEAAFQRIADLKVREGLLEAVAAAAERARELGRR